MIFGKPSEYADWKGGAQYVGIYTDGFFMSFGKYMDVTHWKDLDPDPKPPKQ